MSPLNLSFLVGFFGYSQVTASRVILPLFALELGAQPAAVGLIYASLFIFPLLLSWPIGVLADRIGSRWPLVLGNVIGACGIAIAWLYPSMPVLYVAGALVGLAFVCNNVMLQNLLGSLSAPHQRARNFSNSALVGSSTNVVGPLVAGFGIDSSGHAVACLYAAALAVVAVSLLLGWGGKLPTPRSERKAAPAGTLRERLSDPVVVNIILIGGLAHTGQDLFMFYLPLYGHSIGLTASAIGVILSSVFVASFAMRVVFPRLVDTLGEARLLIHAFVLSGLGFALTPLFQDPWLLGMVAVLFGAGMGCAQPVVLMLLFSSSPEGRSGETVGLRQTANNIARVATPPLFGFIGSLTGLMPVFMISAAMMAWGGWLTRRRPAPHHKPPAG